MKKIHIVIVEKGNEIEGRNDTIVGVYDNKAKADKRVTDLFLEEMERYADYYEGRDVFHGSDSGEGVAIIRADEGWDVTRIFSLTWTVNAPGWYDLGI